MRNKTVKREKTAKPGRAKQQLGNAKTYHPRYIKDRVTDDFARFEEQTDQEKAETLEKLDNFNRERRGKVFKYFGYACLLFIALWIWSLF